LTSDQWWYFVTLGILALLLWMTHNLVAGRIGRAIRAMRDHPIASRAAGIDVAFGRLWLWWGATSWVIPG
jgi:branched-chain amino acid transport system permease protein